MSNKYFGTDGIRGTVNQGNITGEKFFKFGLAAATYFKNQKKTKQIAIIAKDTRLSGYTLEPALVIRFGIRRNACFYIRTFTNQWTCDVNKINEGKHGHYDYRIS